MIVLVGKTCSGKSTVADILEEKYGIRRVRTYTTRPPRTDGECNEYHFVSDEEFERLKAEEFFFETTQYTVASGDVWKYGTARGEFTANCCIVMNPDGMKKVHKLLDREQYDITVVYLNVTEGVQWNRLRQRGSTSPDEATRRIACDKEDFVDVDQYYDFSINTDDMAPHDIAALIQLVKIFKSATSRKE